MWSSYTFQSGPDGDERHIIYKLSKLAQYKMSTPSNRYEHNKESRDEHRLALHNEPGMSLNQHLWCLIYEKVRPGFCYTNTHLAIWSPEGESYKTAHKNEKSIDYGKADVIG